MPLALAATVAAFHDLAALSAAITAFAGVPATVDPRLRLAACPTPPVIAWAAPGSVSAACPAPAWRIFVPASGGVRAGPPPAVVRRGDAVSVAAVGPGFRVALAGVAEADAAVGGRVRVRDTTTGARLNALVTADGSLVLPDYAPR